MKIPTELGVHYAEECFVDFISLFVETSMDIEEKNEMYFRNALADLDDNQHLPAEQKTMFREMLVRNRAVFSEDPGLVTDYSISFKVKPHSVYHRKSYPIPHSKLPAAQREIDRMFSLEIIEPSSSENSSPILCVDRDSTIRLCLDARNLNDILINDRESLPRIDDIMQSLHG